MRRSVLCRRPVGASVDWMGRARSSRGRWTQEGAQLVRSKLVSGTRTVMPSSSLVSLMHAASRDLPGQRKGQKRRRSRPSDSCVGAGVRGLRVLLVLVQHLALLPAGRSGLVKKLLRHNDMILDRVGPLAEGVIVPRDVAGSAIQWQVMVLGRFQERPARHARHGHALFLLCQDEGALDAAMRGGACGRT